MLASATAFPTLIVLPVTDTPPVIAMGPARFTEPPDSATVPVTVTGPAMGTLPLIVTAPVTFVLGHNRHD